MERIVVLGLGNILYGDEGFGVRVAERLYSRYAFPDNVEIVDAGTCLLYTSPSPRDRG